MKAKLVFIRHCDYSMDIPTEASLQRLEQMLGRLLPDLGPISSAIMVTGTKQRAWRTAEHAAKVVDGLVGTKLSTKLPESSSKLSKMQQLAVFTLPRMVDVEYSSKGELESLKDSFLEVAAAHEVVFMVGHESASALVPNWYADQVGVEGRAGECPYACANVVDPERGTIRYYAA